MQTNHIDVVNARILVVEDDDAMREFIVLALTRMGVRKVKECADGTVALQLMGSFWPDVVLTDIHMEPMGGIEFVHRLRDHLTVEFRKTRVIFMSADSSRDVLKEALSLGAYGYIVKPISFETLRVKIEHALSPVDRKLEISLSRQH